jgi:hypothetical protein
MVLSCVALFSLSVLLWWVGRGAAEAEKHFDKTPPSLRLEKSFRLKRNKSGTFGIAQTQSYVRLPS